jgi:hypothetical protein
LKHIKFTSGGIPDSEGTASYFVQPFPNPFSRVRDFLFYFKGEIMSVMMMKKEKKKSN